MAALGLAVPLLLCSLLLTASGQGGSERDGWWDRMKAAWNDLVSSFNQLWSDFVQQVTARSRETWTTWREEMLRWLDSRNDMSDSQKTDMRQYIERMEVPPPLPARR